MWQVVLGGGHDAHVVVVELDFLAGDAVHHARRHAGRDVRGHRGVLVRVGRRGRAGHTGRQRRGPRLARRRRHPHVLLAVDEDTAVDGVEGRHSRAGHGCGVDFVIAWGMLAPAVPEQGAGNVPADAEYGDELSETPVDSSSWRNSSSRALLRRIRSCTLLSRRCWLRSSSSSSSSRSMCSLVRARMARCASRSWVRLRASCDGVSVLTLRVPGFCVSAGDS